jgi:hypothetical protein
MCMASGASGCDYVGHTRLAPCDEPLRCIFTYSRSINLSSRPAERSNTSCPLVCRRHVWQVCPFYGDMAILLTLVHLWANSNASEHQHQQTSKNNAHIMSTYIWFSCSRIVLSSRRSVALSSSRHGITRLIQPSWPLDANTDTGEHHRQRNRRQ